METRSWTVLFILLSMAALLPGGCAMEHTRAASVYQDGVFRGVSQGSEEGYAEVFLTIGNDQIVDVKIAEYNGIGVAKNPETYLVCLDRGRVPFLKEVYPALAGRMIEQNTWEVDIVSGATATSTRIREAAQFSLQKARVRPAQAAYFDGTFMAASDATEHGWHLAWVTLDGDRIVEIRLEGTIPKIKDSAPVFDEAGLQLFEMRTGAYALESYHEARVAVARKMVEAQSYDVDAYTGATLSSNGWMVAVARALQAAKTN